MNRKMHDPRTSWHVVAKAKDSDRSAVADAASVPTKLGLRNATVTP